MCLDIFAVVNFIFCLKKQNKYKVNLGIFFKERKKCTKEIKIPKNTYGSTI